MLKILFLILPFSPSIVIGKGVRDLFWLPVEQYRKDGRIVRGLQRGANAFTTSTAMAILELANRLVQAVQCTAETAYDVVSPGPSVKKRGVCGHQRRKRPSQPADIREGMANAYHVVKQVRTSSNFVELCILLRPRCATGNFFNIGFRGYSSHSCPSGL